MKVSALAIATALFSTTAFAAPLTLQTYNPQENAIFAVNSTLASGPHEAVLFDAQFSVKDGEKLVEMINKSGKKLTHIVITSGDPDFYFGLEPLVKAFPQAKVVATEQVVKHIEETKKAIVFTRDYLEKFEQALKAHKDSASVIKAMKAQYPGLAEESSLELSAKVNTGEMKW